jgi:hypothetical protein
MLEMTLIYLVSYFFGGAFLTNAVPHLVSGTMGKPFQTPFAKPPGRGLSSSSVNVAWAFSNLVVSYVLVCLVGNFGLSDVRDAVVLGLGSLAMGLFLARRFGRLHGGNTP